MVKEEAKEKKAVYRNSVKLVGYLKETTLEERTSANGKQYIWGNVIVAVDEFNTHRVKFTVYKEDNEKKYEALSKFLPENTISIASYLKSTATATFAVAANMAAKVWVMASFEEYATKVGEREKSVMTLRGFSMGMADPDKEFVPGATFEVDCYLEKIDDEVEEDSQTGRLSISALLPGYNGIMHRLPLVVGTEDNAAKAFKGKYKVGDTARLIGKLVAMRVQLESSEPDTTYFGQPVSIQANTRFVRENVIISGPTAPIAQGAKGSISIESVKEGLAKRENIMIENGQRKSKSKEVVAEAAKVEPAAPANAVKSEPSDSSKEDFDF